MIDYIYFRDWICRVYFEGDRLILIKLRRDYDKCVICDKKINKGDYCYGNKYGKVCIDCLPHILNGLVADRKKELTNIQKVFNKVLRDLNKNKEKYEKNNVVNSM